MRNADSRWLVEIWLLSQQGVTGELEVEFKFQNSSSTDKYWNPVPGIRNPQSGIQNPWLSWIPFHRFDSICENNPLKVSFL